MATTTIEKVDLPVPDENSLTVVRLPHAPSGGVLWRRVLVVASIAVGLFLLDRFSALLLDYWLLESLGYPGVFWTNFWMGAALFGVGFVAVTAAVTVPAVVHGLPRASRRVAVWIGVLLGLLFGYGLSLQYLDFLGPTGGPSFGEVDPVFGNDIAFYAFDLPMIEVALQAFLMASAALLIASVTTAVVGSRDTARPAAWSTFVWRLGRIGTPLTRLAVLLTGATVAALIWLRRYDLLTWPNFEESTEDTGAGAQYLDVVGLFSTKNAIYVEALAVLALTIGVTLKLRTARRALHRHGGVDHRRPFRPAAIALVLLPGITADLVFRSAVAIRDEVSVAPNEPVIQLEYLQRHVDATWEAFGMAGVEERDFVPAGSGDPLPDLQTMLDHPSIVNAPLWSGFTQRYGRRVAPQYVQRILQAEGDMTVYGPTLEIFQAQERLRAYYDFLDVDTTVHQVDGEPTMFASAAREIPQDVIRPWFAAWGQRAFLFTHGHGMVGVPVSERTDNGDPVYGTSGIPTQVRYPALGVDQESLYYGEGSVLTGYSNAAGLLEHDIPTDQGRAEVELPSDVDAGVVIDSWLKRLVIGYHSGTLVDVVFSDLIDEDTRAHVFRRPLERVQQVAPFLALDTDPYVVPAQNRLQWMVHGMTYSEDYPYSGRALLGDNSDLRTEMRPLEEVNYIRDAVKVTVDATTGQMSFYQVMDEPIIATWANVYPELFQPLDDMPADLRAQMQYPQALMSIQFNKIYPYYHQRDALTFYSSEDLLDDADEVMGPVRGEGGAITFSQGLYNWMVEPGGAMPESVETTQFALSKSYTPQDALNLRAIATAYQSGGDYGRLSVLKVPKGRFHLGPEQADAAIDQNAFIAQQIGLWNRLGVEVIRGSTSLMVVEGEALYVEPVFIRSRQNPVPQLQRVIVVLRGQAHMGRTIQEALTFAIEGGRLTALDDLPIPAEAPPTAE